VNGTNENGAWDRIKIRARMMNWLTRINASAGVNKSDAYKKWERRRDKQWPNFNGLRTTLMNSTSYIMWSERSNADGMITVSRLSIQDLSVMEDFALYLSL
jgi:hypothetical protein